MEDEWKEVILVQVIAPVRGCPLSEDQPCLQDRDGGLGKGWDLRELNEQGSGGDRISRDMRTRGCTWHVYPWGHIRACDKMGCPIMLSTASSCLLAVIQQSFYKTCCDPAGTSIFDEFSPVLWVFHRLEASHSWQGYRGAQGCF